MYPAAPRAAADAPRDRGQPLRRAHGRNWGCGDFRDLRDVVDWVAEDLEASFVALNPLHAIHNRRPFNTSPYLPNCIFYQNFLYLDIEGMEDFAACRRARALRGFARRRSRDRRAPRIPVRRVRAGERAQAAFRQVRSLFSSCANGAPVRRARASSRPSAPGGRLLEDFATYCALDEYLHHGNPDLWSWTDWPTPYQDPRSAETLAFRKKHWRSVLFYQYLQWQIDLQLADGAEVGPRPRLSIGLYHDLALATDRFGSDL